jgi:hypothetical protein
VEVLVHGAWHDPEFVWFRRCAEESAARGHSQNVDGVIHGRVRVRLARREHLPDSHDCR